MTILRFIAVSALACFAGWTPAAVAQNATRAAAGAAVPAASVAAAGPSQGYRLGTGDKVRVTVFGEPELSGEYDVDDSGFLRLNLVGQVKAAGLTIQVFEQGVKAA